MAATRAEKSSPPALRNRWREIRNRTPANSWPRYCTPTGKPTAAGRQSATAMTHRMGWKRQTATVKNQFLREENEGFNHRIETATNRFSIGVTADGDGPVRRPDANQQTRIERDQAGHRQSAERFAGRSAQGYRSAEISGGGCRAAKICRGKGRFRLRAFSAGLRVYGYGKVHRSARRI